MVLVRRGLVLQFLGEIYLISNLFFKFCCLNRLNCSHKPTHISGLHGSSSRALDYLVFGDRPVAFHQRNSQIFGWFFVEILLLKYFLVDDDVLLGPLVIDLKLLNKPSRNAHLGVDVFDDAIELLNGSNFISNKFRLFGLFLLFLFPLLLLGLGLLEGLSLCRLSG